MIIISALVVSAISFNVSMSWIFLNFREWISSKSKFLEKLIHCPWCFAHYVTFVMLLVIPSLIIDVVPKQSISDIIFHFSLLKDITQVFINFLVLSINFLFTSFSIVGLTGLIHYILLIAYDPAKKAEKLREIEKRKLSKKEENK